MRIGSGESTTIVSANDCRCAANFAAARKDLRARAKTRPDLGPLFGTVSSYLLHLEQDHFASCGCIKQHDTPQGLRDYKLAAANDHPEAA